MSPDKDKQTTTDDKVLWQSLVDSNAAAFDLLVKRYSGSLFNYGSRFCQDRDIIKDCIQELFIELWNKRAVITQPNSVKWYLFVALRNRIFREQSKWNKTTSISEDQYDFLLEFSIESKMIEFIEDVELAEKFKKILESLPPRQREIVYLRYYEDLNFDQIAVMMNINKQSVHNLLQKAYKSIRSEWVPLITFLALLKQLHDTGFNK